MAGSEPEKAVESTKPKQWPRMLVLAASIYALWFAWLAYVAWVNVSAGNQ